MNLQSQVRSHVSRRRQAECLSHYSLPDWEHKLAPGRETLDGDQSRLLVHFIISETAAPAIERSARICVPQRLQGMAGIEDEIIVIGMYDWLEIWSREQ